MPTFHWLKELFRLPRAWSGIMVTGASMANFVALAAARQRWAGRHSVDVSERGLSGLPPMPELSSGYVHASARKVLALLGHGRDAVKVCAHDPSGRLDLTLFATPPTISRLRTSRARLWVLWGRRARAARAASPPGRRSRPTDGTASAA